MEKIGESKGVVSSLVGAGGLRYITVHDDRRRCNKWEIPIQSLKEGAVVNLTATLTPGGVSGSVEFFDGAASLGSSPVASGMATLSVSTLAAGAHPITVLYGGDASHLSSLSPAPIPRL